MKVREIVDISDHRVVFGEVVEASALKTPKGHTDEAILETKELGDNVFYSG